MNRPQRGKLIVSESSYRGRLAGRTPSRRLLPVIEGLENRIVLTSYAWNTTAAPTGGDWDNANDWLPAGIPTASDVATISFSSPETVTHSTTAADAVQKLTTSNTILNISSGSIALGNGSSSLGAVTVGAGATLSVSAGASVTIAAATTANTLTTLTDDGTLSFASGDTLSLASTQPNNYYGSQVVVGSGGLFQATGTTFLNPSGSSGTAYTQIVVQSGGNLQASSSTFAIGQLNFNIGAVVAAGYLSGDAFNLPLYIPAIDVQYLSGTSNSNLQFQTIYIQPDTLVSGQSVALNKIGTQNTSNLSYGFPGNFTINQGASLASDPTSR